MLEELPKVGKVIGSFNYSKLYYVSSINALCYTKECVWSLEHVRFTINLAEGLTVFLILSAWCR